VGYKRSRERGALNVGKEEEVRRVSYEGITVPKLKFLWKSSREINLYVQNAICPLFVASRWLYCKLYDLNTTTILIHSNPIE
jgi:hypothetical protein